jgi:hypothetical protein
MTYWLLLMIFVPGAPASVTHVGNFSTLAACTDASKEADANISALSGGPPVPGASYRVLCLRSSDVKALPPQ